VPISRYRCTQTTCRRRPSQHHSGCLNFRSYLSACATLSKCSSVSWTKSEGVRFLLCPHRRHPGVLSLIGGARATPQDSPQVATGLRNPAQPGQMCLSRHRSYIPRLQALAQGITVAARQSNLPPGLPAAPGNQPSSKVSGDAEFLPPIPAQRSCHAFPLHALLGGPRTKGSQHINWTPALSQAFEECKTRVSQAATLAHPDGALPIALVTDASTTAMGAVLQQQTQDSWRPLTFFSKKMSTAQQRYSAYDRELLAIYEEVKPFRHLLEARHFMIFKDHKPLTYAFSRGATSAAHGNLTISTFFPSSRRTSDISPRKTLWSPTL